MHGLIITTTLLLLSISCLVDGSLVFSINPSSESCVAECLPSAVMTSQSIPCCSIELVTEKFGSNISNVSIYLSGPSTVAGLVLFQNISSMSIIGVAKTGPSILCRDNTDRSVGLRFENVSGLRLSNVRIVGCGGDDPLVIRTAVAIVECSNVSLVDVDINDSRGTSLFIENSSEKVSLKNVKVAKNKVQREIAPDRTSFARGVFVYISSSKIAGSYKITNCVFQNITTPRYGNYDIRKVNTTTDWLGYGLGGGLSIVFDEDSTQNNVTVKDCLFDRNYAPWGGGMYVRFQKDSTFNSVLIDSSYFQHCVARLAGAGVALGTARRAVHIDKNIIFVKNSIFRKNHASYGAGASIYALHTDKQTKKGEFVNFYNCSWIENWGRYSPAVDIAPTRFDQLNNGALPIPVFHDCTFTGNRISFKRVKQINFVTFGVFVITKFTVSFVGKFLFERNVYTALLLNSGRVILEGDTQVQFVNNTGFQGGALSLHGFASLFISNNCMLKFLHNTATEYGGAIFYYPIEQRELFEGRVCFLQYNGMYSVPVGERNISFVFTDNFASVSGSSIYSTSLLSCYYSYRGSVHGHRADEFLLEIGNITFNNSDKVRLVPEIGTAGNNFFNIDKNLTTLPGRPLTLHPLVKDDLGQEVHSEFFVRVQKKYSSNNLSPFLYSPYTINRSIILYGVPNERARLVVSTHHPYRSIQYTVDVVLLPCPPGYHYTNFTCRCSAGNKDKAYLGIVDCNDNNFTAVIERGFWAGYYHTGKDKLYTASCPFNFCVLNTLANSEQSLTSSSETLSSLMCGSTRQGVLCGECKEGYSVYYHSMSFTCGQNDKCSFGPLLFVFSELLPIFTLFTLIIVFDVSFSSGSRNGFIFFCQMVTILPLDHATSAHYPVTEYLKIGYKLMYGIFNIEFFSVEPLSFCLFRNATVMDILAFKYVSTVFALILVILLIVCLNNCTCCDRLCSVLKKKVTTHESVLHGLSAFLIICYVESVRVSFFILRLKILKGFGGTDGPNVAFFGGIDYFRGKHILYIVPAIVTLGTIAFFPPLLLLLHPTVLKLLQLCKLSEHRFVIIVLRVTKINSMMPLLDVFQGHFKDNLRFFAGLFFVYRVALLTPYSFSQGLSEYAIATELVLLLVLSFHSIAQPYKENAQNIIDSLLLSNLAIINGLSIAALKVLQSSVTTGNSTILYVIIYLQFLLIYLPMLVVALLSVWRVCRYIRQRIKKTQNEPLDNDNDVMGYLEYLDEERSYGEEIDLIESSCHETRKTESL